MQAAPRTFHQLFTADVQYEIPVFQRQYVWGKGKQLQPLWEDIRSVADRAMELVRRDPDAGVHVVDTGATDGHFLGAIVLDDTSHRIGVNARPVIDGQQRLTTLQLLISAIREVATEQQLENQEKALEEMLFHAEHQIEDAPAHHRYRVWPSLADRSIYRLVIDSHGPAHVQAGGYGKHRIASAEAFFREQVENWVVEGPDAPDLRLRVLVRVVQRLLRVVVIELDEHDNAQLIFETLNARGEDLLAAELVKNFLFQHADRPGVDLEALHRDHWEKFEGPEWRKPVGVGRRKRPRIEQFLFHWLTMQTASEVSPDALFPPFRRWMKDGKRDAIDVLKEFSSDADIYRGFDEQPAGSDEERFFTRLDRLDTNTPIPVVLWLYRQGEDLSEAQRVRALRALESWLVRRALCRETSRGYNQFFLDILETLKGATANGQALDRVLIEELASKPDTPSRSWPTDQKVRSALMTQPLYGPLNQRRIRMVLRAIEDHLRKKTGGKAEKVGAGDSLHIEHLLPQAWEEHWVPAAPAGLDESAAEQWRQDWIQEHREERTLALHSLGNLTLLTQPLNSSVQNGPWSAKRSSIDEFSAFRLNRDIVLRHGAGGWDETGIAARGSELVDEILEVWPGPGSQVWAS